MPTISIFYGIIIQMYWRDHNPPHVHALYQGHEALIAIQDGSILAVSLPKTAERIVIGWVQKQKAELLENWERGRNHEPFETIAGADSDD